MLCLTAYNMFRYAANSFDYHVTFFKNNLYIVNEFKKRIHF